MDAARRGYPPSHIRVSDADRDQALAELSEHFQAGRLTSEEFDERSGQALQAKTGRDLTTLFTDLPRVQVPMTQPAVSPNDVAPRPPRDIPVVPIAVVAFAIAAALSVLSNSHGGHHHVIVLAPVLLALIIIRGLARGGRRRGRL